MRFDFKLLDVDRDVFFNVTIYADTYGDARVALSKFHSINSVIVWDSYTGNWSKKDDNSR